MERSTIADPEPPLTEADRAALPRLPDVPGAALCRGAFVTLEEREGSDLRGCIGHVMADRPLGEVIRQVAVSAARSDPRFPPVQPDELPALRIEISVLDELAAGTWREPATLVFTFTADVFVE